MLHCIVKYYSCVGQPILYLWISSRNTLTDGRTRLLFQHDDGYYAMIVAIDVTLQIWTINLSKRTHFHYVATIIVYSYRIWRIGRQDSS